VDAPLLPTLPGYDNPELIAHGTTALVFRALQRRLNRLVAIKVITVDTGATPANAARELATTVALSSQPHIVSIIDTGVTDDDRPYIVMEYCEDGSYAQILRQQGPLPIDDVIEVGIKIGEALHAAHQAGIVHRDVKPSNILRSRFGPALTDFGIARAPDELSGTLTREMMTPHHASPEALLHQAQSGPSDVYSLASTMWALLVGHPPFVDPARPAVDMHAFRDTVLHEPLPRMPREDVPAWLTAELTRAMSKLPSQRHATALELAEALRRGAMGILTTGFGDQPARPEPVGGTAPGRAPAGAGADPGSGGVAASARPEVHVPGLPAQAWPAGDGVAYGRSRPPGTASNSDSPGAAGHGVESPDVGRPDIDGQDFDGAGFDGQAGIGFDGTGIGLAAPSPAAPSGLAGPAPSPTGARQPHVPVPPVTAEPGRARAPIYRPRARPSGADRPDRFRDPGQPSTSDGWSTGDPDDRSEMVPRRRFDERDLVGTRRRISAKSAVLVAVVLLAVVGTAAAMMAGGGDGRSTGTGPTASAPATPTHFITAATEGSPRNVRLTDRGDSVIVSWTDPTAGTVSFLIAARGPDGEQLAPKNVARGTTAVTYTQLDRGKNYCFLVGAIYAYDRVATAAEVCTKR
jgi:hypothetical protein